MTFRYDNLPFAEAEGRRWGGKSRRSLPPEPTRTRTDVTVVRNADDREVSIVSLPGADPAKVARELGYAAEDLYRYDRDLPVEGGYRIDVFDVTVNARTGRTLTRVRRESE